ncbi:hypothetical protein [Spirillospora sp. NBC_01491]|uniref:hypothetical protein n=1 Tax=Spirillospora sp. NBC_01491 TaxID=2976007 RepID=UPI002E3153E6|nr:hypothetical protein [Spirillospora sp. NBC_01491]
MSAGGLAGQVHATLKRRPSNGLGSFGWGPERGVRLAGAHRLIRTGTPVAVVHPDALSAERAAPVAAGDAGTRAAS